MEPISESLRLLKRQAEIERRQSDALTLHEERELFAIRARLTAFPAAVRAIAELARARHQSVEQIRVEDVERWDARG
jgi:hypothetical protein